MVDTSMGFLQLLFGQEDGYLALGSRIARTGAWQEHCFHWVDNNDEIAEWIRVRLAAANLYYCATLLTKPKKNKVNVATSRFVWADLDDCPPDALLVPPSILIRTSEARHQALWLLDKHYHATDVEMINKRIAYRHKNEGCDTSGWDLTQFLRIPGSRNFKYSPLQYSIDVLNYDLERTYGPDDFSEYPVLASSAPSAPMPNLSQGVEHSDVEADGNGSEPPVRETGEEIMLRLRSSLHPRAWSVFETQPADHMWSQVLWNLELMLFNVGASPEEVFTVCQSAACNKFIRDGYVNADELLWKDVLRAHEYSNNQTLMMNVETEGADWFVPDVPLLTEEERTLAMQRRTVVEEYIEWAKTVGDAAPQYHEAGAFMILSTLLSGSIRLPTSFGTVIPNLWFMILADTTLTRKTTAMDLAIDLLGEIDADCILATDGSIEGLMTALSMRQSRPSIFLRDEFSGLLDAMAKKDYYSGMLETFTKLYDGKLQKRVLKKEVITVREPVLLMFAGGIKERIYSLLTPEHINSGFVPRFCFITAESDITRVKPLGPPTEETIEGREVLRDRFLGIYNTYNQPPVSDEHGPEDQVIDFRRLKRKAQLTPEAWIRYNEFDATLMEISIESSVADLLTPMMARLCISGLKAAVLLAAADRLQEGDIIVTIDHLTKAFYFVERWKTHALNVLANAGKTNTERELERIYDFVQDYPGTTRASVMQRFRLTAREMDGIQATLQQRGLVNVSKAKGKGEQLFPVTGTRSAKNVSI